MKIDFSNLCTCAPGCTFLLSIHTYKLQSQEMLTVRAGALVTATLKTSNYHIHLIKVVPDMVSQHVGRCLIAIAIEIDSQGYRLILNAAKGHKEDRLLRTKGKYDFGATS